ncbi:hypothetical protein GUITHDRAFT_100669 [Guillardia theta CCMP2712]|uniref:Uncharacterized protein n=1 Tax=Guillardia theta (strain CCMP2712) TaxID=905079 RepID=L1JZZ7_GUITC|nr:hypothetical protein GUITHDRAFT_100669 [Guillardia theta CCMP2712]EKX53693.1 hypothetical protein GUITHDRAFT_100669 [Guillardia theta CCMP2712]|eukprot:XP_005840673.1 hypothetical protein GUITHDRAFT_100669 [Guillardia theta CCMP2712]
MAVQVDKAERILLHLEKELSSMKAHYMEIQANDDYVHFTGDRNEDPDVNNAIGISSPFIEEPRNQRYMEVALSKTSQAVIGCSLCWDATDWDLITEISSCISPDGIDEERMRGIEKASNGQTDVNYTYEQSVDRSQILLKVISNAHEQLQALKTELKNNSDTYERLQQENQRIYSDLNRKNSMLRSEVQYLMETLDCHSPQLHSFLISEFGKDDCTVNTIAVEEMFHEGMKAHDMVGSAVCMLPEQYNEQLFATFESLKSKLTDELRTASRSACGRLMAEQVKEAKWLAIFIYMLCRFNYN